MSEIRVDISDAIAQLPIGEYQEKINAIHERLHSGQAGYTGWVEYPTQIEGDLVWQIMTTAWLYSKTMHRLCGDWCRRLLPGREGLLRIAAVALLQ